MSDSLNPTERFSNRVEDYRLYRPSYPAELLLLIQKHAPGNSIADIGAGTGILTRLLLQTGFSVTAVEPNGAMRAAAESDLASFKTFTSVHATAEETGLASGSLDAITAAQAFHWFRFEETKLEFNRILRPGGIVFLIWNERQIERVPSRAITNRSCGRWARVTDPSAVAVNSIPREPSNFLCLAPCALQNSRIHTR